MYPINEQLKEDILSKVPSRYTKLEKAIFIYNELCSKLEYSMEYFIDEDAVADKYTDIKNLKYVDGKTNKQVVCFTFNCIFLELLDQANVCDEKTFLLNNSVSLTGKISKIHEELLIYIDDYPYIIDATYGVLDNNDLTLSKYSTHQLQGWLAKNDEDQIELNKTISKVRTEALDLHKHAYDYVTQKQEDMSYHELPLQDRARLFLKLALVGPEYSVLTFNYLLKLKHLLFKNNELEQIQSTKNIDIKAGLLYVKDTKTNEYKAIFLYNPVGYTNDKGYENFDDLQVYVIDLKNRRVSQISPYELKENFAQKKYTTRDNKTLTENSSRLLKKGDVHIKPIYEGGQPIWNEKQQPQNLTGYVRTYLLTGKQEYYDDKMNLL